jgi:hyperosmotically inducible periplasmic protein
MLSSRTLGAVIVASVALAAAPASVVSQTTTDKMESKAKSAAEGVGTGLTDSWLTAKTKIALFADERVSAPQVSVGTKNGMVTLRGKVDSSESMAAAVKIAKATDGVKGVQNELQVVSPSQRAAVDINDRDINGNVRHRLAGDTELKDAKIDARVDSGVVTLTGEVQSIAVSARASEIVGRVPGVRAVKNDLTYGSRSGLSPELQADLSRAVFAR